MKEVVIIDAVRSPIGRVGGSLSSIRPDDLLADVLKGLIKRTGIDPALIEDVYAGCGNQPVKTIEMWHAWPSCWLDFH